MGKIRWDFSYYNQNLEKKRLKPPLAKKSKHWESSERSMSNLVQEVKELKSKEGGKNRIRPSMQKLLCSGGAERGERERDLK